MKCVANYACKLLYDLVSLVSVRCALPISAHLVVCVAVLCVILVDSVTCWWFQLNPLAGKGCSVCVTYESVISLVIPVESIAGSHCSVCVILVESVICWCFN